MKPHYLITLLACLICMPISSAEEEPKRLDPIAKDVKHPKKVNLKLMSSDPEYGYTDKKPILVGSRDEYGGPAAEREYLESLLDSSGKPVKFKRLYSGGNSPDGKPLDCYEVTISGGKKVRLWLNMYHSKKDPKKQPAPVGFYKSRD